MGLHAVCGAQKKRLVTIASIGHNDIFYGGTMDPLAVPALDVALGV